MVKVDWNKFKAKFSEAAPYEFESLAYYIFCYEHNRKTGIFRFRNHPALETSPIKEGGCAIGFQAKFYEGKLAAHKKEIIEAIKAVQSRYPDLDQLEFFLPSDFDPNSKAKGEPAETAAQREIESAASESGLKIDWFCKSRFEMTLSGNDFSDVGRYYFSDERSTYDFMDALRVKSGELLLLIKDSVSGKGITFKIDRTEEIKQIKAVSPANFCVVYGDGGVGKSGLIKELARGFNQCIVLRPMDVIDNFDQLRMKADWNTSFDLLLEAYDKEEDKLFVLDSAEKIADLEGDAEVVFNTLMRFKESGWRVMLTARNAYRQMLESVMAMRLNEGLQSVEVLPISEHLLSEYATRYGFALPEDALTQDLLRIPFYLDAYLKLCDAGRRLELSGFKLALWNYIVAGERMGDAAALVFIDLVEKRVQSSLYWLDIQGVEPRHLTTLVSRGILSFDSACGRYFTAHDVYEEWALERISERAYAEEGVERFFEVLSKSRMMVRAYRFWLLDKLRSGAAITDLIDKALSIRESCWFDETIIAVMNSPSAANFLKENESRLFRDEAALLRRVVRLVFCACRTYNDSQLLAGLRKTIPGWKYYITKPSGGGWSALIGFLADHAEGLHGFDLADIVCLLHDWCQAFPRGVISRKAAALAFEFANTSYGDDDWFEVHHDTRPKLIKAITTSAIEIKERVEGLLQFCMKNYDGHDHGVCRDIFEAVLGESYEHLSFIKGFPELTRQMAKTAWLYPSKRGWSSYDWAEGVFGLTTHYHSAYAVSSAYKTPAYWLLWTEPEKTVDWIVEIVNQAIANAARSGEKIGIKETEFVFPDGTRVKQYISDAIWSMHRGSMGPVTPHLLQSIHMALERYILEAHKVDPKRGPYLEKLMLKAIRECKSASIAGVATSLVLAHPDDYFDLASVILTSREAIRSDHMRCIIGEAECKTLYAIPAFHESMYANERLETLKDEFRLNTLETVMMRYQVVSHKDIQRRKARMESLLDGYSKLTADEDRFFVQRSDARRNQKYYTRDEQGRILIGFNPILSDELAAKERAAQDQAAPQRKAAALMMWADSKMKGEKIQDSCLRYDKDLSLATADFKELLAMDPADERLRIRSMLAYPAAAFLIFSYDELDDALRAECKKVVVQFAAMGLSESYLFMIADGYSAAVAALPAIVKHTESDEQAKANILLLAAMLNESQIGMAQQRVCDLAFDAVRWFDKKWPGFGASYVGTYVKLRGMFQEYVHDRKNEFHNCFNPVATFLCEKMNEVLTRAFGSKTQIDKALKDPMSTRGVVNAILLFDPNHDTVCAQRDLILKTVGPALMCFYHLDKEDRRLSSDCLQPAATQYQRQLIRMVFEMDAVDVDRVLERMASVPLALADRWMFQHIVGEADRSGKKDVFWHIWEALFDLLKKHACDNAYARMIEANDVWGTYLLGRQLWKAEVKSWRCFDKHGVALFERVASEIPASLSLASAFVSFANSIGREYWRNCLAWIAKVLSGIADNEKRWWHDSDKVHLKNELESFMVALVVNHRAEIKRNAKMHSQAFVLLDYLNANQSIVGYQLREALI